MLAYPIPVIVGTTFNLGFVTAAVATAALLIAARSSDSAGELEDVGSSIRGSEMLPSQPATNTIHNVPTAIGLNLIFADQLNLCFDTGFTP